MANKKKKIVKKNKNKITLIRIIRFLAHTAIT